ncbi:hypothetical protein FZC66_02640 [Priestia megaterium]|nr:hypothetical protein FZC66_02640 [Priestia megaterium]
MNNSYILTMNQSLINKMIDKCLKSYGNEPFLLIETDYNCLYKRIRRKQEQDSTADLYEIINDVVYDYLTDNGQHW